MFNRSPVQQPAGVVMAPAPPASPIVRPVADLRPQTSLEDIPRIIDLIGYTAVRPEAADRLVVGGRGAVCYYGPPACAHLGGTEIESWVDGLFAEVAKTIPAGVEDFRISYQGMSFRGCRDPSSDYGEQLTFRRLPSAPPTLGDLRMDVPGIRALLEGQWLNNGGLVLLCGLTGQGKTTIAGACVRTRLETFHGRCVTVEDVIEMPLEGNWGQGTCRQIRADYDTEDARRYGFAGAVRRAYRSLPATRPAMLYIGEVRDVETATEVIKASANGMLVITTIHAGDVMTGLMRLLTLGQMSLGASAADALAAGLRIAAHHTLDLRPDVTGWGRGSFSGSAVVSNATSSEVANVIRSQKLSMLSSALSYQATHLRNFTAKPVPVDELLRQLQKA